MDRIVGGWQIIGVGRIQTGELLDLGNVRIVGMTVDELRDSLALRVGANGQLFYLPQDIIDNTVKAFNVSATSPNGYGALGAPTGRYLAPANGPDCIETSPGFGDCGIRSLVVNAPPLIRFDLSAVKRVRIRGDITFEFRAEMLNAFNRPYFDPVTPNLSSNGFNTTFTAPGGPVVTGTPTSNGIAPSSADGFRLQRLLGDHTSPLVQPV